MELINLNQEKLLAEGGKRNVYAHPNNDELIIKVWKKSQPYWKKELLYEVTSHARLRLKCRNSLYFIEKYVGIVNTNLGLGLAFYAEKNIHGLYAGTLKDYLYNNTDPMNICGMLDVFFDNLKSLDVIHEDITTANILIAYKPDIGDHLVLCDGFRDEGLQYLSVFGQQFRQYHINRKRKKINLYVSVSREISQEIFV